MTALPKAPSTTSSGSRGCPRSRLALDPRRGSCGSSTHHPGIPRLPGQLFSVCQCFLSPCFQRHNTHECGLGRWPGLPTLTSSHLGLWGVGRKSLLCTGCLPPCAPSKPSPSLQSGEVEKPSRSFTNRRLTTNTAGSKEGALSGRWPCSQGE